MAKKGLDMVRDLGKSITPIVVGTLFVQGTVALPALGQGNVFLGWALALVGVLDLIGNFR